MYERNLIRSSLKDPNGVPELSENSVKNIKKEVYALFTDDMKKNESLPKIKVGGSNGTKNGDFEYRMDEDGSANGGTVIKFYKSAFKSNYILARTILHEYYHAGDFYSGNAGMKMWSLRYKLNLKGNELQNAYTDYFERGVFNYVRGLGAYQDKNYYYNQKLYHR
ncbi:hypothetical protein [Flavobacterium gyeonganense]|uniref:Tox-MPTase3 domain-containing protein n=1 Tax=Flavobacterium gyeonganense TaxID=1310418 RepID=A0ABV5HD29_9FLAO|nr:hypothetical protein [Flavobacterium gyeonganense]